MTQTHVWPACIVCIKVEQELADALAHKSTDESDIKKLKLRKLAIKQQMEKLRLPD